MTPRSNIPPNVPDVRRGLLGATHVHALLSNGEMHLIFGKLQTTFEFTPFDERGCIKRLSKDPKQFPVYIAHSSNRGRRIVHEVRMDQPELFRGHKGLILNASAKSKASMVSAMDELAGKIDEIVSHGRHADRVRHSHVTMVGAQTIENGPGLEAG